MDWLKVISFIIPSIALFFSINARLKRFNNERISVYKDMKSLSSELRMEDYEIKVIDNELNKLIIREATGIYEVTFAKKLMKILSCNPNLDEFKISRLKRLIRCILEREVLFQGQGANIAFYLDKGLFNKRAREGILFIVAFFVGFIACFMAGTSAIVSEEFFWATIQLLMSLAMVIITLFTVRSYPAPWKYNSHKKFIEELKEFKIN